MLNHLPMILDDTSKKNRRIEENFEGVVYDLCSGKGKTRSNRDIGINAESHWNNCILTNGERPLTSYVNQAVPSTVSWRLSAERRFMRIHNLQPIR